MQGYKESHKTAKREKDKNKDDNYLEKKFKNRLEAVEYETSLKKLQGLSAEEEAELAKKQKMFEKRIEKSQGGDGEERVSKPKSFKPGRTNKAAKYDD